MDALERSARAITAREEVSGTSVVDDEAVGRGPTTAPAPLRVPRAMGACGGRPHGRVYGDRVSRVMGGVLRSTREEGARLRVPPRGRGAGDDQWCSPPSSRASPLPPLGESAVVDEVVLLVVIPPSPRFALPGLDAGVVGQSVTRVPPWFAPPGPGNRPLRAGRRRFLPGSRRPAGTAPGPKRVGRPWSGPAAAPPPRSEPARPPPRPRVTAAPPSQSELQPLPGEPPSGSLTGTATTPGDAPRRPPIHEIAGQPTSSSTSWSTCSTPIREIAG